MTEVGSVSQKKLKMHAMGMIGVLIVQYLLGMFTNLFVQFPQRELDGQLWEFAWRQLPLALHIIVGIALLFGTIALIMRAVKLKNRLWTITSSIAALAILVAGIGGAAFIPSQTDAYSFMMAIGFIIALLAFGWGLYASQKSV